MKQNILLYHLYVINNWKKVTEQLLSSIPHQGIVVNISFDLKYIYKLPWIWVWLKLRFPKISKVFFTFNNAAKGELLGFMKFKEYLNKHKSELGILTYIHSKGVSKPNSKSVADWRELMRYFILERWDLTEEAFRKGYKLYGCNLFHNPDSKEYAFKHAPFIFRGNFVNVNYELLGNKIIKTDPGLDYYAIEGYWGKLCDVSDCYCCHESNIRHYEQEYPEHLYKEHLTNKLSV